MVIKNKVQTTNAMSFRLLMTSPERALGAPCCVCVQGGKFMSPAMMLGFILASYTISGEK